MANSYTAAQKNWLTQDLVSQSQKTGVDIDLSSKLATLLRDRNAYQQQTDKNTSQVNRDGRQLYLDTAESFAARGLGSSTPYVQADDQAFQGVQTQLGDIRSQLAEYLNNYDAAHSDARAKAEQQKRQIEAEALQRYAQQMLARQGA